MWGHKSTGCPIVPVVSWHPEGGALLDTPRGQDEGAFFLQEREEEAGAGQGEVYGHSSGAPAVCLTPSGLPTWSCGAVFIAAPQLPHHRCPAPGGHSPGPSQGKGNRWRLVMELHQQRKASWLVSAHIAARLPLGGRLGGRESGWVNRFQICPEAGFQILPVPLKMCFLPSVGKQGPPFLGCREGTGIPVKLVCWAWIAVPSAALLFLGWAGLGW